MLDIQKEIPNIREGKFDLTNNVYLYAVGGFPLIHRGIAPGYFTLFGQATTMDRLKVEIQKGLGVSGMLTYLNKSDMSNQELGSVCQKLNHTWGYHWMTLSMLIVTNSDKVEKTFLRSNLFYESWTVNGDGKVFGVTGTIKSFIKFCKNHDDKSFDLDTRLVMKQILDKYEILWK